MSHEFPPPKVVCPECRRASGVLIVRGLPTAEAMRAAESGDVFLGGCVVTRDMPTHVCTSCDHVWVQPNLPLIGRTAVVTGVSRRRGIGYAVAERLAEMGADVFIQHWAPHDEDQPWGGDDLESVLHGVELSADGRKVVDTSLDLSAPGAGEELIARAHEAMGHLDILVCNHARSGGDGTLEAIDADMLDAHWAVNARSTVLATKAFAVQHDGRNGGRVIWMTSGQVVGPMRDEIAYAASKAALAGLTPSVADWLIDRGIVMNTVNPGPVNTGYLDVGSSDREDRLDDILAHCPTGRFGEPDDPARLIAWLVSDEGRWMVGQVLSTEGGFRR
ncbi:SDR family oxidoreductase [Mariniluteicoccus endophyticus]